MSTSNPREEVVQSQQPTSTPVPVAGQMVGTGSFAETTRAVTGGAPSIEDRVRRLERAVLALQQSPGDLDRAMDVAEVARAIGKTRSTLWKRLRDAHQFDAWRMEILFQKDPTGHWISSPRRVAKWRQVMFRDLQGACK